MLEDKYHMKNIKADYITFILSYSHIDNPGVHLYSTLGYFYDTVLLKLFIDLLKYYYDIF